MSELIRLFLQGGFVMWPLLFGLIVVGMIMVERISYYRKSYYQTIVLYNILKKDLNWSEFCQEIATNPNEFTKCIAGIALGTTDRNVLQSRLEDVIAGLAANLERGLGWLSTIVTMAPLLGLLGTVTGMIKSFQIFGSESGAPTAITGGVAEALVATAFGLCVAIAALTVHSYFNHRLKLSLSRMEMSCGRILDIYDRSTVHEKVQ